MANLKGKKAKEAAKLAEDKKLAASLGITPEELADRNVPKVGFDEERERRFDYGTRSFVVTLDAIAPKIAFAVFELEKPKAKNAGAKKDKHSELLYGKKTKSLPKAGKNDDPGKAEAAQEEFKQMKKELNAVVKKQKKRLELALMTGRCWSREAWRKLFGEHPILRPLSFALVWGIYEGGQLVKSFRFRMDGLFYDAAGKVLELTENARIGLVFPAELTKEERKAWQDQIWEDNMHDQPIEQLVRKTYIVHKQEAKKKDLVRCKGQFFLDEMFGDKLGKFGWHQGCPIDEHEYFNLYYREDPDADLCVELHTSGNTPWDNMEIRLYGARFYKAGTFDWETHAYDEQDRGKAINLEDVPARYFSEVVRQIMEAAAESYLGNESDFPGEELE